MKAEYLKRFNETYPSCDCGDQQETSPMLRPRLYTYPLCGKPKRQLKANHEIVTSNSNRKWQKTLPNLEEDVIQEDLLSKDETDLHKCTCSYTNDRWLECYDQRLSASPFSAKRRSYSFPSPGKQDKSLRYKFGVTITSPNRKPMCYKAPEQLPLIQELSENEIEESQNCNRVTNIDECTLKRKCKELDTVSSLGRISQNNIRMQARDKRQYNVWRGLQRRSFAEDGKSIFPDL